MVGLNFGGEREKLIEEPDQYVDGIPGTIHLKKRNFTRKQTSSMSIESDRIAEIEKKKSLYGRWNF